MKKKLSSKRSFGILFGVIFIITSIYIYSFKFTYLIFTSIIFFVAAIFYEKIFRFPNMLWMKFGVFLGKIINPLICVFLYFFVIGGTKLLFIVLRKKTIIKIKQENID